MDSQLPECVVDEPLGDLGPDALPPPHSLQGDAKRAFVFLRAGGDQADMADKCPRLLIFHQPHEPREVLVGRGHILNPLLQSGRDVVCEGERPDLRVVVQVKEEVTVARLEGAQNRPRSFERHDKRLDHS